MGGILRQPDSVRGLKEGGVKFDAPETNITAPKWLSKSAKKEFKNLVEYLTQAQVPIKQIDSYAIAMAAQCISFYSELSEKIDDCENMDQRIEVSKQISRHQRDAQKWMQEILGTPTSRARIGMKTTPKQQSKLAQLIEMKKGNAK